MTWLYKEEWAPGCEPAWRTSDEIMLVKTLQAIVDRSNNGDLGTSKVNDMRKLALDAIAKIGEVE